MRIVHLMASPFVGGPERQMLGLARHLPASITSIFLSFSEQGQSQAFLNEASRFGFEAQALEHNFPHLNRSVGEIAGELKRHRADLITCSGYKPDILGWRAARKVGIPVVLISHGWTAATWRVRFYEAIDRRVHRWADQVVCVSQGQAERVRRAGVRREKMTVIPNAVAEEAFAKPDPEFGTRLAWMFGRRPRLLVGAVGRLSPEKGFDRLVEAAPRVLADHPEAGFVVFGEGPERPKLERRIQQLGLQERFLLGGFQPEVTGYLPHLDLAVLPSFTEGLPIVLLEACAAGLPVVASRVGGIPEVVDERTGILVPAGDVGELSRGICQMLAEEPRRRAMGQAGRRRVREQFTFPHLVGQYQELFERLVNGPMPVKSNPLLEMACEEGS